MATVSFRQLSKHFSGMAAVDNLNLDIKDGEFVSLLGPSGCGKTTTLRLLAGFLQPDSGEILVGDEVVSSERLVVPPERRNMSMIFQSYAVWPHMTVTQNVAYGLKFKKLGRSETEGRVTKLLQLVHLEDLKDRYPGELSGGQQQRVALARALVVEPQIMLMDEPLSNLDANLREEMRFEIRRLHEEFGITTVYVTHDQAEAMATSDRVVVLNRGHIVQSGPPAEIFDRPATRFVAEFVGKANLLSGVLIDDKRVQITADLAITTALSVATDKAKNVAVCIRPHSIRLAGDAAEADRWIAAGCNLFAGMVERVIYFGETVDYTLALDVKPLNLRAVAPPNRRFEKGQRVFAAVEPSDCVIVADGE